MKNNRTKNKLLIIPIIAILCSTSFFMVYDTENSDAAPPTITLTTPSNYTYSPVFSVSPWKLNEYNSISYVYTTTVSGSFTSSWWAGQIPGITLSAYGGSVQSGNTDINSVNNGNGKYSYYFKLSGTPTTTGSFDARNQFLPVFPILFTGMSFNFAIVEDYKSYQNSVLFGNDYRIYASEAMEFLGATWMKKGTWRFEYNMAGLGHAEGYYGDIWVANIDIVKTINPSNMVFITNDDPSWAGSWPASNDNIDYGGIALNVIGLAITAIGNLWLSCIWAAINIISLLAHNAGTGEYVPDIHRTWIFNQNTKDVGQFLHFEVDVPPNQTVQFSYEYFLLGPRYEGLTVGKNYWTLHAGPPNYKGLSMNPEHMTPSEREQCGIETIARADLWTRATELNISEATLKEWLESDEYEFYYAHDFIVSETPQPEKIELNRSTLTKDLLINELYEQMEWSEKIIRGFSTEDICDREGSTEIIQKHTSRLASLQELQKQLETCQKTDSVKLNSIFDSYCDIMDIDPKSYKTV